MEELIQAVAQVGFPIAVSCFLLWKGYTLDREYLSVLTEMRDELRNHTAEKEKFMEVINAQMELLKK